MSTTVTATMRVSATPRRVSCAIHKHGLATLERHAHNRTLCEIIRNVDTIVAINTHFAVGIPDIFRAPPPPPQHTPPPPPQTPAHSIVTPRDERTTHAPLPLHDIIVWLRKRTKGHALDDAVVRRDTASISASIRWFDSLPSARATSVKYAEQFVATRHAEIVHFRTFVAGDYDALCAAFDSMTALLQQLRSLIRVDVWMCDNGVWAPPCHLRTRCLVHRATTLAVENGTYTTYDQIRRKMPEDAHGGVRAAVRALCASNDLAVFFDDRGRECVAIARRVNREIEMCECICVLATSQINICEGTLAGIAESFDETPDADQDRAIRTCLASRLGVIAGRGGTGKTSVVARNVAAYLAHHHIPVVFLAPTHVARVNLAEALSVPRNEVRTVAAYVKPLANGPPDHVAVSTTTVVVDESSMVGSDDMHLILAHAMRCGHHVILIGDHCQLAPVPWGSPFEDIVRSGAVGVAHLSVVRRTRSPILAEFQNAYRPVSGELSFESVWNATKLASNADSSVITRFGDNVDSNVEEALRTIVSRGARPRDVVVLAWMNNDVRELIQITRRVLHPHSGECKGNIATDDIVFVNHHATPTISKGLKGVLTRIDEIDVNDGRSHRTVRAGWVQFSASEFGYMDVARENGLLIQAIGEDLFGAEPRTNYATGTVTGFDDDDERAVSSAYALLRSSGTDMLVGLPFKWLKNASCMTVHSAQGIGVDHVVFAHRSFPSRPMANLNYTAVSRAKSTLTLAGPRTHFTSGNSLRPDVRNTVLGRALRAFVAAPGRITTASECAVCHAVMGGAPALLTSTPGPSVCKRCKFLAGSCGVSAYALAAFDRVV